MKFKEGFLWGAATSGPQCEGTFNKKHKNVFDYWYEVEPELFFDKVGPEVTSNFYNSYKEDLAMLKSIGLNSFRTSIQWTRLIKDFETGEADEDGVEFYNNVINEIIKNDLTPIITLHHFDLPVELYDKYGGWESKHVVDLFVKFANTAFGLFSDRVKLWTTFNEPIVVVEGQYLYQFHYPKVVDGKKAVQALYNINLASAKAIKAFKENNYGKYGGKIGIILNLTPSYPRDVNNEEDVKASKIADALFNESFLMPAIKGEFPKLLVDLLKEDGVLWESTEEELKIIKENNIEFLGVNYYFPRRIKAKEEKVDESKPWMPDKYFDNYEMPGRRMNPYRGWEIYPKAVYDIAINIRDNYNNIPWYISENGMGVEGEDRYINFEGVIEDDYRIEFIKEHLEYLHKGIEEGSNCFGYHSWTGIDCWSWCNAYKNRYGFIALDLKTQKKTIKKSGQWIKEFIK
ncbi:MAG: glycoside hydrolase family 1 protein [Clostridium sp.]|nr:glycoside hydrolase family 1 protein [Clostridium sp.]MDU5109541.1 glycoside hydrolase family 1 protein [Clostridium sp.]